MLQLLEYGIAVITTPMNRFHDHLHSRIAGSGPVRQLEQKEDHDSENEVVNGTDDCQEIELDGQRMGDNFAEFRKEIKVMKQEMREVKNRMDNLFKMIEKIMFSNNEGNMK